MKKSIFLTTALMVFLRSYACGFLTKTVETPAARTLGQGILEFGVEGGVYKAQGASIYSNDKNAWGNFGMTDRLEGGITLYTSTMAAANVKVLLLKGGRFPSLAVGMNNISGRKKETFTIGAPGDEAVSNSAYGVISQNLNIGGGVLIVSAGKGNRSFVDESGDYESLGGIFAGLKLKAGGISAAVEEDGRDINCAVSFNFPTGMTIGANARNLKENLAPRVFGFFLNFSNNMIEQRISALEARMQLLGGDEKPKAAPAVRAAEPPQRDRDAEKRKQNAEKNFQKAMERFENNEFDKSIPLFEKTLSLEPSHKKAEENLKTAKIKSYFMTGHRLFAEGKYTESIKFFERVIELLPGHPDSTRYINRAKSELKK